MDPFNYESTSSLNFLQAGCSSWCQLNSDKALKAKFSTTQLHLYSLTL